MKKLLLSLFLFYSLDVYSEVTKDYCPKTPSLFKLACQRIHQIFYEGDTELYFSGYAWHNRYTYSREKIQSYNEKAWGGGLGKAFFDEQGNWHGVFSYAFLDSHKSVQPVAGYAYLKVKTIKTHFKAGLGYTVLITGRPDLNKGIPFPGALPWASLFYKKASVAITYIPGFNHNGNVLYVLAKYAF